MYRVQCRKSFYPYVDILNACYEDVAILVDDGSDYMYIYKNSGKKQFPKVEEDENGLIVSSGPWISYRPKGSNVDWVGPTIGPY